jgi:hypothetical protein
VTACVTEFFTETFDVGIEGTGSDLVTVAPDFPKKFGTGVNGFVVFHEGGQKLEFGGGEIDGGVVEEEFHVLAVEEEATGFDF